MVYALGMRIAFISSSRLWATVLMLLVVVSSQASDRPNILWLSCEDISAHIGSYGDPHAITPNVDKLATEGVRYSHAFTSAGVCAPCRSGIITGMYQTSIGGHHMRCTTQLPDFIKPFPHFLKEGGYYTSNSSKQDYQFKTPDGVWDESGGKGHWRRRKDKSQPFFSVFNFTGCHESGISSEAKYEKVTADLKPEQRQDAKALTTLPPYYQDTPGAREDWKRNYELITAMDAWVGDLISQLKEDGLYENTIVFYWSDHGVGLPRAKRWLYDSGTHIPLVVRIPEKYRVKGQGAPHSVSSQLVSSIDFGPTVLSLAGLKPQDYMQGVPFLGQATASPREYVYGARDRMDERYDIIRMVRDNRFKYIRNYEPLKTWYQYMNTPEKGSLMKELRIMHEAGKLNEVQSRCFGATKQVEELYDTQADPHEINNIADDPKFQDVLKRMRAAHLKWVKDTRDLGLIPEPVLIEKQKEVGNQYEILRRPGAEAAANRIADIADLASQTDASVKKLARGLNDKEASVRYWAAVGLGNRAPASRPHIGKLHKMLKDTSSVNRTAAARALCRLGEPKDALPLLVKEIENGAQWERLHASIVLDEIDDQALPVMADMKRFLEPRKDLYASGKYVIRVLNRALNQLQGTDHKVN
ncbi:sulfatase-like hydrolase/transferase [Verrucomicrobia bacterium]|nr:sulfatase-like hydrolase/transferase [Verrucomicrobiota bacterium]